MFCNKLLIFSFFSIFFLLGITPPTIFAEYGLSLFGKISYYSLRDEVSSPLAFNLLLPQATLAFEAEKNNNRHEVAINFMGIKPIDKKSNTHTIVMGPNPHTGEPETLNFIRHLLFIKGEISYQYTRRTLQTHYGDFLFGGMFDVNFSLLYFDYPQISMGLRLSPVIRWDKKIYSNTTLFSEISFPLFAYQIRPPFASADEKIMEMAKKPLSIFTTGQFTSIHEIRELGIKFGIQQQLTKSWRFNSTLSLLINHISFPRPSGFLSIGLDVGITWIF